MNAPPLLCAHRRNVRVVEGREQASCALLEELTGAEEDLCAVAEDVCRACSEHVLPAPERINPVVASLLYQLARRARRRGGVPGCDPERARRFERLAEANLAWGEPLRERARRCDVVVCCDDSSDRAAAAVESVLAQEELDAITVHLVDDGGGGRAIIERFAGDSRVRVRRNAVRRGPFATLHDLVPHLASDYVAVQDPRTRSRPRRLSSCIRRLEEEGADLLGATLETPGGLIASAEPQAAWRRYLPAPTLVFRRASLVDLGGFAARGEEYGDSDADTELVWRAFREGRKILAVSASWVEASTEWREVPLGPVPAHGGRQGRGFPESAVACDVVLPFHERLDWVEEALRSILEQEGAEAVVHLVDDASSEDTSGFLRRWRDHRQVRCYRNRRNLGPYISFDNVVRFLETDLVAVQDADDISLPDRLRRAANDLRVAGADIFGASVRLFGELHPGAAGGRAGEGSSPARRASRYPARGSGHFLLHPTALLRSAFYASIGGFADLGSPEKNRCGLDSDLYSRAYHAGAGFAVSRGVVVKQRLHAGQATRNASTGRGTARRAAAIAEWRRRVAIYRRGEFDPREFGSRGRYRHLTRRLSRK